MTSDDVKAMERAGAKILMASVRDRFGDYGRVALATFRPPPPLALSELVSHTLWHFLGREAPCEAANADAYAALAREADAGCSRVLAQGPDTALPLKVCVDARPPPRTHTLSLSAYWC